MNRARLTVTTGPDRGRVFELAEEMVNIGRGAQNEILLTDLQVAEHQATLMSRNGRYAIYVLREDSVEVDGKVIPAEQWVWLPDTARIKMSTYTGLRFQYEGTPDTPHKGRWWELIAKYGVTILYCAPTAIRTFMKWGDEFPAGHDLSSLRLLGTVGEPINPEAWVWYRATIGGDRTPVVDTWWQTETGAIMISPLPGVTSTKPGSAMGPLPGISADVVDDAGAVVENGHGGYLVLTEPWPAMLRTIWGDDERYRDTYWTRFADQGYYFAGDGAKKDDDGDVWLLGRVDDVMNVSGHRISTTEVESALVSHAKVAEAAVVGASDPTTGQGIVAFVILRAEASKDHAGGPEIGSELREHVAKEIGPIAKPRQILVVAELPKTRSGKIMRRLLRDVAENREMGDVTTLADPTVMNLIGEGLSKGSDD